jgi:16S rRNA (adenine1518-N6/adenine1519-N6)-dimethyltransferase
MSTRPKKHFGQHFLHERGVIERIVAAIAPQPDDRIVEIGPGEGALTLPLLRAAGRMTAIELDTELIEPLRARAAEVGELDIIHADALKVDLTELARGGKLRLAGNLPYYVSSPILFHCLAHADAIADMHFMLQKEVVDRMAAGSGNKVYGRLSVMLQLACHVEPLLRVAPGAFRPPPKVESAVVRLVPLPAAQRPEPSLSRAIDARHCRMRYGCCWMPTRYAPPASIRAHAPKAFRRGVSSHWRGNWIGRPCRLHRNSHTMTPDESPTDHHR